MQALREFLNSKPGKVIGWAGASLAVFIMVLALKGFLGESEAVAGSTNRTFICAETGKAFSYHLGVGDPVPVLSPHSGKNTGYQAELCYWSADGQIKDEPTPVLLNLYANKRGPTFCPDCGRLVVPHNPRPQSGDTAPPKEQDYKSRKDGSNGVR